MSLTLRVVDIYKVVLLSIALGAVWSTLQGCDTSGNENYASSFVVDDWKWPQGSLGDISDIVASSGCKGSGRAPGSVPPHSKSLKDFHKIELPLSCGKGQCSKTNLETYNSEFFFFNTRSSTVIFCSPAEGGTSSGSKSTRSELRGNYYAMDNKNRRLVLEALIKVHAIASSQVTVGQIHGDNNVEDNQQELMKIQVTKKEVQVAVGNGKKTLNFGEYNLGEEIHYKAVLGEEVLTITINGKTLKYDTGKLSSKGKFATKVGAYCKYGGNSGGCFVEVARFETSVEE